MQELATKTTKKTGRQAITVPAGIQKTVFALLTLSWLGSAVMTLMMVFTTTGANFRLLYTMLTAGLPLLFFVLALFYAWQHYGQLLQRLFVASILAASGYAAGQVVFSAIFTVSNHFGWVGTGTDSQGAIGVYAFEWLLLLLVTALYVLLLGCLPRHPKMEKN